MAKTTNQNTQGTGVSPEVAALGAASINALGGLAVDAAKNKRQWKYQQQAMDKQYQMNLNAWNMQNAYNTPASQMQRLQDAGLNPRLIYGGGSSAPNMASPQTPVDVPVRQAAGAKMPDLLQYYQVRQMDAQYQQTTMATDIMRKTGALKDLENGLQTLKLARETFRGKDAERHAMFETDLKYFLSQRARHLMENEATKGFMMDQTIEMRSKQATGLDLDNAFKRYRNELAKLGIYSSDHPAMRILIQAAKRMEIDLGALLAEGANNLKYLLDLKKN